MRRPRGGTAAFSARPGLAAVVADARAGAELAATGVASGTHGDVQWVVVDPVRHPLAVQRGRPSRRGVANVGAAVATNGPMMGRRIAGRWKVTRELLVGVPTVVGVAVALVGARTAGRRWRRLRAVALGSVAAGATAVALLDRWLPCGIARGAGFDDRRDFDGEGADHAWIGRFAGGGLGGIAIGDGALPDAVVDGSGGLVRLVRDGEVCTDGDAARLRARRGVAAWALLPADDGSHGVVVVIGAAHLDVADAATMLREIGARDAVASDPSGCAFVARGERFLLGPPPWARRRIQCYSLACGARG
jgi:hypothetical protein